MDSELHQSRRILHQYFQLQPSVLSAEFCVEADSGREEEEIEGNGVDVVGEDVFEYVGA